jgi:hypothetical protein
MVEIVGEKSGTRWAVHPPVDMLGNQATLYESPETGLRGMLIATGEPLSNVHVVIATEANTNEWSHKDDGLPHTLEHAIFLGSDLYPFKGILDKLANRSLADGTNAWTATGACTRAARNPLQALFPAPSFPPVPLCMCPPTRHHVPLFLAPPSAQITHATRSPLPGTRAR